MQDERKFKVFKRIAVEGNIGAGKSSFLHYLNEKYSEQIKCFPEPVERWTDFNGFNLLDEYYKNKEKFAFPFQVLNFLCHIKNVSTTTKGAISIFERSPYSSFHCFCNVLFTQKEISPIEYSILNEFLCMIFEKRLVSYDLFVYIDTKPENCLARIDHRSRDEEKNVSLHFLQCLQIFHDRTFLSQTNVPIIILDGNKTENEMIESYENCLDIVMRGKKFKQKNFL